MKDWKTIFNGIALVLAVVSTTLVSSCADPCSDVLCKNNGICRDGACVCADGFEGPICEYKMYEKFIGTWDGTYRCNGNLPLARTMIITPTDRPDEVRIFDLFNQNATVTGKVAGTILDIPSQTVNGIRYSGNGYVNGKYIVMYIQENDEVNNNVFSCDFNGELFQEQ